MLESAFRTVTGDLGKLLMAVFTRPRHYCVYCDSRVLTFLPYKGGSSAAPSVVGIAAVVGSDLDNFSCPRCKSTDRERHLLLYLREVTMLEELRGARILHFAPEPRLSAVLKAKGPGQYIAADLFPSGPDIRKLDMEDIDFPDNRFDLVIANHVLEHVNDDMAAMREVQRVLMPGGLAILQTPYAEANPHTEQDPAVGSNPKLNLELYGQEDHLRLFGADIFYRIQSVGLESCVTTHKESLPQYDAREYGVNAREPFMCFRKPGRESALGTAFS